MVIEKLEAWKYVVNVISIASWKHFSESFEDPFIAGL
jgi:hypothetical protein